MSWLPSDVHQAGAQLNPPENYPATQTNDIDTQLAEQLAALKGKATTSDESTANDPDHHRPISPTAAHVFGQDIKLPSPPSKSPGSFPGTSEKEDCRDANPGALSCYQRASSCPVSNRETNPPEDVGPSSLHSLSSPKNFDSYIWSCTYCDLPNPSKTFTEQFHIPPLKEKFRVSDDRFDENEHWEVGVKIGQGAFGQCYMAQELNPDSTTLLPCVKVCNKQYKDEYDELLALTLGSIAKYITEIVEFYGATITPTSGRSNKVHIFMEFMAGGSVEGLLKERVEQFGPDARPVLKQEDALVYLKDVLKALEFLHGQGMVHNDVKGENVLLDEFRLHAKLADFGSATSWRDSKPNYDIWLTGCFLMEMLEGERPALCVKAKSDSEFSGQYPSCAGEKEKEILSQCFSRECTAAQIIQCLNSTIT